MDEPSRPAAMEHHASPDTGGPGVGRSAETAGFHEAAKEARAQAFKEKVLHEARERYGEIESDDPRVRLLRGAYDRLLKAMPDARRGAMRFLASPDINAFAIRTQPDVFLHDGLLRGYVRWCGLNGETPSEDAFAFVVAHELGHIRQGTEEVDASEDASEKDGRKYDEEKERHERQRHLNDEYDADRFGLQAMARAGYNPREGIKMLAFLRTLSDGISLPTTHPRSDDRLRELVALVESPDTIVQNTDAPPTALEPGLARDLSREDARRPGTALYRAAAKDRLGDFILSSETMSDALEVVQVAQMHRYLGEIDRLRRTEAIRTAYAKQLVADNVRQLVHAIEYQHTGYASNWFNRMTLYNNLPKNSTRYAMREFGVREPSETALADAEKFDGDVVAGFTEQQKKIVTAIHKDIDRVLTSISRKYAYRPTDDPGYVRMLDSRQKLEYIRDHMARTIDGVDHKTLGRIAVQTEINPQVSWEEDPATGAWIDGTKPEHLLAWCESDGSSLFSHIARIPEKKVRQAVGDVAAVDSRYQPYLSEDTIGEEDVFTQEGRAAFLEQLVYVRTEKNLEARFGSLQAFTEDWLDRTKRIPETLRLQLRAKLETRYAFLKDARKFAEAMAQAILSDDLAALYALEKIIRGVSKDEALAWNASIEPQLSSYRSSANALFLAETDIQRKAVGAGIPNAYEIFYALESRCTEVARERTEGAGDMSLEELKRITALGDGAVRATAINRLTACLKGESWAGVDVVGLENRLSPILLQLTSEERRPIFFGVFGIPLDTPSNFSPVFEFAAQACPEYAQRVLQHHWEYFSKIISTRERIRLLRLVYANQEGFLDLSIFSPSKDFINNCGSAYIKASVELNGESAFMDALTELAERGVAYGGGLRPLFGDVELQGKLEALSDQEIVRIASCCKAADVSGKLTTAWTNEFYQYVTQRVLYLYGVKNFGLQSVKDCRFDTSRRFEEVFAGIGEHVMPTFSESILKLCADAYHKTPVDVVVAGLERYYPPIPESSIRIGRSLENADADQSRLDDYARKYDPRARPFYEQREYVSSLKLEAVDAFVRETGLVTDRSKTAAERLRVVVELIPEKTDYRDALFGEIERDFLEERGIRERGHRLLVDAGAEGKLAAAAAYAFYAEALTHMVDQARMQPWGRRANALYVEHVGAGAPESLGDELARIRQLFPRASFARDEALYALGNTPLVRTPEQARRVQGLLTEMQRQTADAGDLSAQSQLERFNVFMGAMNRAEKKDFLLWTIGASDVPPKSLRAYGGLNRVSVEDVPALMFAAAPQEREAFLLRMLMGDNGLFEPQNSEDEKILVEFVGGAFDRMFPDDDADGVAGKAREILRTVFSTVLTEYDPYRGGKIFIGLFESMRGREGAGRGEKIVALMNELGPVFVKVGQVLSETEASPGEYLLPEDVRAAMRTLKQSAKRFHRMAAVFSLEAANEFDKDNPDRIVSVGHTLAAASIKQVNAVMRADGREAVEKVLRPSVEKHLREDVRVLAKVVGRVRAVTPVPRGVEEAGATYVAEEADFVREAANTKKIDKALRAYAKNAVVAKMRVRTTETYGHGRTHIQEERVRGLSLEELSRLAEDSGSLDALAQRHGLTDAERDAYVTLAKKAVDVRLQAFDALAYQYFQADAFHADPHAGNVMVTPKGELVFIDNGSIGETAQADRNLLKKFFLGFALQRPRELRTAVQGLAGGLKEEHLDAIVEIARSPLGDTDKLRQILVVVTERAEKIHPAFDKFLKSFATGAYLMAGLKPDDVRLVLGAYTQGDSGSLLSYAAASAARAARENPTSLVARTVKAMMES